MEAPQEPTQQIAFTSVLQFVSGHKILCNPRTRSRCSPPANATISDAVITYLCRRLRDVSDKLETIALYRLEIRLARFLLGAVAGLPDTAGRRTPLELRYSQSELALLLGASRPKLNVALGALERAGAVGRTLDRLFCDRAKIAQSVDS